MMPSRSRLLGQAIGYPVLQKRRIGSEEVLEGLDGVVGVAPVAGGVVEDLVGEQVLIGGVEGGVAGVVQAVGIHLNCCGVSG